MKFWVVFGAIELVGLIITALFSSYRGITAATSIVEVFVFLGQYLYSHLNVVLQERENVGKSVKTFLGD